MVTVWLVRHAAHADLGRSLTGRQRGGGLSKVGRRQAADLARWFGRERVTAIHTSPSGRAIATAKALAGASGAPVRVTDALDEIDFGNWTGRRFDELATDPHWVAWNRDRGSASCPGGETMQQATNRIVRHIDSLQEHEGSLALVTHADMIRGAVAHTLGLPLDNMLRFDIDPASRTRLEVGAWGARLGSLNEAAAAPETPAKGSRRPLGSREGVVP